MILPSFFEERDRWFLFLPVLMAGGIAIYFALPYEPPSFALSAAPLGAALAAFSLARRLAFFRPFFAALFAFALGLNAAQIETLSVAAPMLDAKEGPVLVSGRLVRVEPFPEQTARLTLKNPQIGQKDPAFAPRYVRMKVKGSFADLPPSGQIVTLYGPLWPPSEAVAPDGYNFRRNAFFKQIGASGFAYDPPRIDAFSPPPFFWDGFLLAFERARRALFRVSFDHLEGKEAAMTAALLSGSQTVLDQDVLKDMRASGLAHLLSISGVHVSMFALLVYVPLRFVLALFPFLALRLPIKKIAAIASIISTSGYVLLVGPETPTVRSALMTAFVMLAIVADRKAVSMRAVALASMPIMLAAPSAVLGPSFQMSFAAVLAMVAFYEKRLDAPREKEASFELPVWLRRAGRFGADIVLTSLVATAATTPFSLFHFQTFSFYGVLANIVAIPLTSFWIMPNLLLTYLAAPMAGEAPFVKAAGWGISGLLFLAKEVAAWPLAQIHAPPMPASAFCLAVGGGLWLCLWRRRWRFAGLLPIALACLYPLFATTPSVFVAEEKALWAIRTSPTELAAFYKGTDFIFSQWKQKTGATEVRFLKRKSAENGIVCEKKSCVFGPVGILLRNADEITVQEMCRTKQVVIAPFDLENCAAAHIVDPKALELRGGHAITLRAQGVLVETVREKRGSRPWSSGWGVPSSR